MMGRVTQLGARSTSLSGEARLSVRGGTVERVGRSGVSPQHTHWGTGLPLPYPSPVPLSPSLPPRLSLLPPVPSPWYPLSPLPPFSDVTRSLQNREDSKVIWQSVTQEVPRGEVAGAQVVVVVVVVQGTHGAPGDVMEPGVHLRKSSRAVMRRVICKRLASSLVPRGVCMNDCRHLSPRRVLLLDEKTLDAAASAEDLPKTCCCEAKEGLCSRLITGGPPFPCGVVGPARLPNIQL
ncbi:hypothetical protein O3P69_009432 [Scylla paramamosain]|uniref:Uncharacterized protein n=1 Tax=Scylla paramamosain TaxID=85552 RepID=A0AAW0STY7_SCYPA